MNKPHTHYATPQEEIPTLDEHNGEIGYFYAYDTQGNEVRGVDLDKVVRMAVSVFDKIDQVGRIG